MIKNEEYKGFWFLPNDTENKVPGILYFEANKEIRLELIGGFETNLKDVLKNILSNKTLEIIHGVTNKNEKINLLICNGHSNVNIPSDFQTTKYICQYFIKGKHLSSIHEQTFNRIQAGLTYLYDWCPLGTIKNSIKFSEDEKTSEIIVSLDKQNYWEKIISIDSGYELKILGDSSFNGSYDHSEFHFSQNTLVEITHNKSEISFADLLNKVGLFKQFLSLATLSPINYLQLTLFDNSNFHEYKSGEKIFNPISLYFIEDKEVISKNKSHHFLFGYKDIEAVFPDILKTWYNSKENLAPIRNHLIASIKPKKIFTSLDFLITVQSLEGYHRRFIDKNDKIVLRKRLGELIKLFGNVSKIKNKPINLTHVVNSRNYYSHFFNKNKNVLDGKELYFLTRQLRNLLICCMLNLIGFDVNLINKLLIKNERL
jgi:hypothetical protein